jgi:hypothetical protein
LLGEEREAGRKKLNTEGVMVDQHKRARQLKDGAQGGQLAGGREAVCEKIKQFEDDHVTCSGREGIRCLL